ncbi:MAG TPA: hypothetical protein VMT79_07830 [Candidatus Binatia bacterium]|nr:hypothetical protein [Candidatus Binatia bacterium]
MMIASPSSWIVRTRLASGLVLVAYLATHLLNHALGLWSLAAMEAARVWFVAFWRHPAATAVLYAALATHVVLAFWSLYRRGTLRMPAWEASQLLLGLAVPPLLAYHVVGTRLAHTWYGTIDSYRLDLTAVGDTVHVASRLEQLTKEHACPLVISADAADVAGLGLPGEARREVTLRNRSAPLAVYLVEDVAALPGKLQDAAPARP